MASVIALEAANTQLSLVVKRSLQHFAQNFWNENAQLLPPPLPRRINIKNMGIFFVWCLAVLRRARDRYT